MLFPSGFPTKTPYTAHLSLIRCTCPAHFIFLDLISRTILGEEHRSLGSSLRSFIQSPVTSSLTNKDWNLMFISINTLTFQPTTSLSVQWLIHPHNDDSTAVEILHPPRILWCTSETETWSMKILLRAKFAVSVEGWIWQKWWFHSSQWRLTEFVKALLNISSDGITVARSEVQHSIGLRHTSI